MTRALATARSPDARLFVVRRIAMGHAFLAQMDKGLGFLKSVEDQFAADKGGFARVRTDFVRVYEENKRRADERRAQREVRKVRNYRRALSARLATAKRRGEQADVERCARLLREFDERVNQSK